MISTGHEDDPGWGKVGTSRSTEDVNDKYFRLREDYASLKQSHASQAEKMKRMATKLLRLTADLKKQNSAAGASTSRSTAARDVEKDEIIEDMRDQVRNLTRNNESLKNKLMVTRQQLEAQCKRKSMYSNVPSRTNSGIIRRKSSSGSSAALMTSRPSSSNVSSGRPSSSGGVRDRSGVGNVKSDPRVAQLEKNADQLQSALTSSKSEYDELNSAYKSQGEHLVQMKEEVDELKDYIKRIEKEHDRQLMSVQENAASSRRGSVQEDINYIKLQREIRDKAMKLQTLQKKYETIEVSTSSVKKSHEAVLKEMENLHEELKSERQRNLELESQLKARRNSTEASTDMKHIIEDLRCENELLKGENQKLIEAAFDDAREKEFQKIEVKLKNRIAELETRLNGDHENKDTLLTQLQGEKAGNIEMEKMYKELQINFFELKQVNEKLQDKLKFFTQEGDISPEEIEEAWTLIKAKKEKSATTYLSFLQDDIPSDAKGAERELHELRTTHAETVMELEKTRKLLSIQYGINKDYKSELEDLKHKVELIRRDYEFRLDEFAHAADMKTSKISKLESQLRDIAYGTREYKIEDLGSDDEDDVIELGRGQNLFEFKANVVLFSNASLDLYFASSEPSTFVTWDFFEFETQATPVVKGAKADYSFTAQYVVDVDDFFLHYIQKESMVLEVHQVVGGTDYRTLGSCNVLFRDLMDKTGRLTYTRKILCNDDPSVSLGTIEYKIYMKLPMTTAISLYRERVKAMGYISHNVVEKDLEDEELRVKAEVGEPNKLSVTILQASELQKVDTGVGASSPSAYCMFKFYDFVDHDTRIVANNTQPTFNDTKMFSVTMSPRLHGYLSTSNLEIFVFDDSGKGGLIGSAMIALKSLSKNESISGVFPVLGKGKNVKGKIEVSLSWKYPYSVSKERAVETYQQSDKLEKSPSYSSVSKQMENVESSRSDNPASVTTIMGVPDIEVDSENSRSISEAFPDLPGKRSASGSTRSISNKEGDIGTSGKLSASPNKMLSASDNKLDVGYRSLNSKKALSAENIVESKLGTRSPRSRSRSRTPSRSPSRNPSRSPSTERVLETSSKEQMSASNPPRKEISEQPTENTVTSDIEDEIEELIDSDVSDVLEVHDFVDREKVVEETVTTTTENIIEENQIEKQPSSPPPVAALDTPCIVTISVNSLVTLPLMDAICEVEVDRIFVCYNFLAIPPEQTETLSLEVEGPHTPMRFNFIKGTCTL